jgi:hypothetical protein
LLKMSNVSDVVIKMGDASRHDHLEGVVARVDRARPDRACQRLRLGAAARLWPRGAGSTSVIAARFYTGRGTRSKFAAAASRRSARSADRNDTGIAGIWCAAVDQRPDPHHVFGMAAPGARLAFSRVAHSPMAAVISSWCACSGAMKMRKSTPCARQKATMRRM